MNDRVFAVDLQSGYNDLLHVGLSQYDVGVVLEFDVFDGGAAAVFPSGTTAKIQGVRPSGVGFDISCTLTGNVVTVSTVTDMTGEAGSFPVEIRFTASGVDVGTVNFVFQIERAAHPDGTIDADITHEQDIVDKINQILVQTTPDTTLSESGVAADSKTVGDNIRRIDRQIGTLGTRVTNVEDDISYQSQRIDRTNKIKAPVIWEEASGNPVVFDDGANMFVKDLTLTLTPSQDLNGYDYAWAGGNGKNKLDNNATSQTISGITFTVNSDGTVTANGTATANAQVRIIFDGLSGDYKYCGCPSGGGGQTYDVFAWDLTTNVRFKKWDGSTNVISDYGNMSLQEVQIPSGHNGAIALRVFSGYTANNLVFKPMIVNADVTDNTFEPYENICPIKGAESVTVKRTGKNIFQPVPTTFSSQGITYVANADGSIHVSGTATANSYWNIINWVAVKGSRLRNYLGMEVKINGGTSNVRFSLAFRRSAGVDETTVHDNGSGATITIPTDGTTQCYCALRVLQGVTIDTTIYPMIRPASISDDTYEPYSGIDTNVDFGQTIYGGTVNPILWDRQGGGIVFDRKVFSVGELTWSKQSGNIFKATPDNVTGSASYDLSDTFRRNPVADSAMENGDFKLTVAGTLYVKMEGFGTAAGFKAAYADAKFCAKLAHSEIGSMYPNLREITTAYLDNVITAQPDKGNVTNIKVTYPADTKAYIDKAIAAISG